jgi:hypothetical protein
VFGLEVKDINCKPYVVEEVIFAIPDHSCQHAIVVKKNVVRLDILMEGALDHFLLPSE